MQVTWLSIQSPLFLNSLSLSHICQYLFEKGLCFLDLPGSRYAHWLKQSFLNCLLHPFLSWLSKLLPTYPTEEAWGENVESSAGLETRNLALVKWKHLPSQERLGRVLCELTNSLTNWHSSSIHALCLALNRHSVIIEWIHEYALPRGNVWKSFLS